MRETLFEGQIGLHTELIVESMSEGVYGIDKNGLCTFINEAAIKMLGYTREQCIGKNMHQLIHSRHKNGGVYIEEDCPIFKTRNSPKGCFVDSEVFWKANGTPFNIYYSSLPIVENGVITGVIITFKDITEKKRQEAGIARIMDSSLDVICTITRAGRFVEVSEAAKQIWGYSPDLIVGRSFFDFVHPGDLEKTMTATDEIINGLNVTNFENRYVHKNGAIVPMVWSSHWDTDEGLLFCIGRDATEKLASEKALVDSEKKYKVLFESNPLPMVIWDFETLQIVDCNDEALLKYGYTREEFLKLTIRELRPAEDVELLEPIIKTESEYGKIHQKVWRHKKKNGELIFMDIKGHLINHKGRRVSLVTANDVTAKLKAEEELKKSEEKYKTLFLFSPIPKWIFDMDGYNILDVNEAAILHYGYSREEFLSMTTKEIRPAKEVPQLLSFYNNLKINDLKSDFGVFTHIKKDGTPIRVEVSITRFILNDKDCGMVECIDVTNREKALKDLVDKDEKLEISNQRFKYATKATSDAILDWDILANTIYWGEGYESIFGYKLEGPKEDAATLLNLIHFDDVDRVRMSVREAATEKDQTNWEDEFRFRKNDGSYAYIKAKGIVIRNETGTAIRMVGAMQDITKQKEEEKQLKLLNKKLRDVSWMQSHIIRAPLSRIMGLIPLLTEFEINTADREQILEYILQSANELDEVIKNITEATTIMDL